MRFSNLFLTFAVLIGVWRTDVKTVLLYRSGAEHDFPMMTLGGGGRLTLNL